MSKNTKSKRTSKSNNRKTSAKSRNKQQKLQEKKCLSPRVQAIIYAALAFIFMFLIIIKGGSVWTLIRSFFFGIFGLSAVLLPLLFGYLAVITTKEREISHFKSKIFLCVGIILMIENLLYLLGPNTYSDVDYFRALGGLYLDTAGTETYFTFGSGILGGIIGYPMLMAFTQVPSVCVCFVILAALILIISKISLNDIGRAAKNVGRGVSSAYEKRAKRRHNRQENTDGYDRNENEEEIFDTTIDIPIGDSKKPVRKGSNIDISIDDDSNAADKNPADDFLNIVKIANSEMGENDEDMASAVAKELSEEKKPPVKATVRKKNTTKAEDEDKYAYHFPPVGLLKNVVNNDSDGDAEMRSNAKKLISTLESFGVKATITYISRGPSVTRYELKPEPGVKISKITNLADDISLNLAANGVRIEAPIPGKAAVGIEVPNKIVSTVSMRELIDSEEFENSKSKLTCVLGKDIAGNIITTDLAKMPHLLIAGTTGSGKSVCVNSLLISILYKATPEEVKLILIDPKMVEFAKYKGLPHLLVPVVSDAKKAAGTLAWAVNEMEKRYQLFADYECKEIDSYNKLIESNLEYIKDNPPQENEDGEVIQPKLDVNGLPVLTEKMPRIVIAIDEFADLMMTAPHEVEDSVVRIAQKARAAGIHLVIATQRPTVNVITGLIKGNVPSRISLKVSSNMDSRVILDASGAEKLIGRGDMLYAPIGAFSPTRVQGCFATDEEIEGVTKYVKKWHKAQYNLEAEDEIKRIAAEDLSEESREDSEGIDVDSKMEEAIRIVIEAGQASTSMIQRRMKVGYARAGRMIDDMEQLGIVGPHQGSKPREVLMTYSQWLERNNIQGE